MQKNALALSADALALSADALALQGIAPKTNTHSPRRRSKHNKAIAPGC
ncbi:MAG: hypothetical protein V7K25_25410 [Nostoc sp.]